jgi:DNA-binding NtrC family response regulator
MPDRALTIPAPSLLGALTARQPPMDAIAAKDVVPWLVGSALAEIERELILHTLTRHRGNRTRAAGVLGISLRTLRNKIRQYRAQGLAVPEPSPLTQPMPHVALVAE